MMAKITLAALHPIVLPQHYNHTLQGWIYYTLEKSVATFLHDRGFGETRKFKMFTFSRLFGKFKISQKDGMIVFESPVSFVVSSPYEIFCESFFSELLRKKLFLGRNEVEIVGIEPVFSEVEGEEIEVETLSPVVVHRTEEKPNGSKYTHYLQPKDEEFSALISRNLCHKYRAFIDPFYEEKSITVEEMRPSKLHILCYKGFVIKGYSGLFRMRGPRELLQMGVDAGFGSKNSMGFGCVRIV